MDTENQAAQFCQSLHFPRVFETFRMAVQPSKLVIALLALAVIGLAGFLMDYTRTVTVTRDASGNVTDSELDRYVQSSASYEAFVGTNDTSEESAGVFSTLWHFTRERFHAALDAMFRFNLSGVAAQARDVVKACDWAFRYHPVYCIIFSLIELAVMSVAGGAICRIAALQFAQGEKPGLTEALRYSIKRFASFFSAPLVALAIMATVGIFVVLLGLAGNIPWAGELLVGLLAVLALGAGAVVAVALIGTVAGFNLMFPAVAYDGADGLDAVGRSFGYVFSRPWRMGFYSAIAAVYGAICYFFVRAFAFLLLAATYILLDIGFFVDPDGVNKLQRIWARPAFFNLLGPDQVVAANWAQSFAGWVVHLLILLVIGLVIAFIVSFYFSANTIIYALLRNKVDNTAIEDVYTPADRPENDTFPVDIDNSEEKPISDDDNETSNTTG